MNFYVEVGMDTQALLTEQRRVGDEFRTVEKTVLGYKNLLSGSGLTAPTRARAEAMLSSSTCELLRLGTRRLELDASVTSLSRGKSSQPIPVEPTKLDMALARDPRTDHARP
jgi:hypothetical protein